MMGRIDPVHDDSASEFDDFSVSGLGRLNALCDRFELAWRSGQRPRIEAFLSEQPAVLRSTLLREFLLMELELREAAGDSAPLDDYLARFPDHAALVRTVFEELRPISSTMARSSAESEAVSEREEASRSVSGGASESPPGAPDEVDGLRPGDRIGPYRLEAYIDGGGMGHVWRAWAETNDQVVALKLIRPARGRHGTRVDSAHRIAHFLREMRAATRLNGHPNIVPVYFANCDNGRYYYVMPYIEGQPLHRLLHDRGPMPPRAAATLVREVALAIDHAHRHGVVHRDIKPRNILIDPRGKAHVLDFGLARFVAAAEEDSEANVPAGTVPYMAPEVLMRTEFDGLAADLFSLGVTFYEALTGRRPFHAKNDRAIVARILHEEPVPPSRVQLGIPPELDAICLRCLAKRPADRYADAAGLARQLGRYLDRLPVEGVRYTPWRRAWLLGQRHRVAAIAAVAAVLALLGLALFWFLTHRAHEQAVAALVTRLPETRFAAVGPILTNLEEVLDSARPHLARLEQAAIARRDEALRARVALAFLPSQPARAEWLAGRLLTTADPDEARTLRDALRPHAPRAAGPLIEAVRQSGDDEGTVHRRIRAAAALVAWNLGGFLSDVDAEPALALVRARPDPTDTSRLIARLEAECERPREIIERLAREPSGAIRANLVQTLGPLPPPDPGVEAELWQRYETDPDARVHASIHALLNRWGRGERLARVDTQLAIRDAPGDGSKRGGRDWFVNSQGQTFLVVAGTPESPLPAGVKPFALAMTELPLGLYVRLMPPPAHVHDDFPCDRPDPADPVAARRPAACVSCVDAMKYCRKLSEADRIADARMAYPALERITPELLPDASFATRTGWRLPSGNEWDFACRAGTVTDHFYGRDQTLMSRYAWTRSGAPAHAMPVGLLRPNPWGFLDMLGNVAEWCSDTSPQVCRVFPGAEPPRTSVLRIQQPARGATYYAAQPGHLRFEAFRTILPFSNTTIAWFGFRLARTLEDRAQPADPSPTSRTR